MFEQLNQVRKSWEDNKSVLIYNEEDDCYYFVLPTQLSSSLELNKIQQNILGGLSLILSHEIFRDLEIPTIDTISKTLSTRFHIMTQLYRNSNEDQLNMSSISVGPKQETYTAFQDIEVLSNYLIEIGDIIENRVRVSVNKADFQKQFYSISSSPGSLKLIKAQFKTLQMKNSIAELAIALGDIAKYPGGIISGILVNDAGVKITSDTIDDYDENLVIIDSSTILNLWRSVKKINKQDIVYLS